eukprot:313826-Amphidinium_carterae.3
MQTQFQDPQAPRSAHSFDLVPVFECYAFGEARGNYLNVQRYSLNGHLSGLAVDVTCSANGFSDGAAFVSTLQELLPEAPVPNSPSKTENSAESPESNAQSSGKDEASTKECQKSAGGSSKGEDAKANKYFARDLVIFSTRCSASLATMSLRTDVEKCQASLDEKLHELKKEPQSMQKHCESLVKIVENRRTGLAALLSSDPKDLKEYIGAFEWGLGGESKSAISPPCRGCASLITIKEIESMIEEYDQCNDRAEVDAVSKKLKDKRQYVQSCVAASKFVLGELGKAMKSFQQVSKRLAETPPADANVQKRPRKASSSTKDPIFEAGPPHLTEIRQLEEMGDLKKDGMNVLEPVVVPSSLVRSCQEFKDCLEPKDKWETFVKTSEGFFEEHLKKGGSPRTAKVLQDVCDTVAEDFPSIAKFLQSLALPEQIAVPNGTSLGAEATWMLQSGVPWVQAEQHHMATWRWTIAGTRLCSCHQSILVCTSETDLYTFLKKKTPDAPLTFAALHHAFRSFTANDVADFTKAGHKLFSTTIAEGDAIYVPPAMAVAELAHGPTFTWGVKCPVVCSGHKQQLVLVKKHLLALGKSPATPKSCPKMTETASSFAMLCSRVVSDCRPRRKSFRFYEGVSQKL